jgi:HK97 family phage major capsid protein
MEGLMATYAEIMEKRERRAKLVSDAKAVRDAVTASATEAERAEADAKFDKIMDESDKLKAEIERDERAFTADNEMRGKPTFEQERPGVPVAPGQSDADAARQDEAYRTAFEIYVRGGRDALDVEHRQALQAGFRQAGELRAQSTTASAGGYTIPVDTAAGIIEAVSLIGGVRPVAEILTTSSGNTINMPTVDDTGNAAEIVAEGSTSSDTDLTFGQKSIGAFMYRTRARASFELLQDSIIDMDALINRTFARRLYKGSNAHFTTGTGSGQPNGIVTASALGYTAAAEGQIAFDDLIELEHSVDPDYRDGAAFMLNDGTLRSIKKIKDDQSRPLFLPGYDLRAPDTILGYRIALNQDMATVQGAAKSVLFGDMSAYTVRDSGPMLLLRLNERYADAGQVGFLLFSRHDGEAMFANASALAPIKHLLHPS